MSMLVSEMKKGTKCFIQGSVDLQDEKAKYIESFGVIAETPNKHAKNVLVRLAIVEYLLECRLLMYIG